jgi:NTE family protein
MTIAFVLSGGGSLGAVQVGMLQSLADHDVHPDLLIGTSVGALNAAFVASHGMSVDSLSALARIWTSLRRRDVFPFRPSRVGAAALGRTPSLCDDTAIRSLIRRHLGVDRLEETTIPVHVVATDVRSGCEVALSHGDAVDAVMASAAIPAVFPAVHIDGRDLIDGGVTDNTALSQAIACGADRVYVLPTGYACALDRSPDTALATALQALTLLIEQRLIGDIAHHSGHADIHVLPPLCPLSVSSTDFRHGAELIARSRAATGRWLDRPEPQPRHPESLLSLHDHQPHPPPETTAGSGPAH